MDNCTPLHGVEHQPISNIKWLPVGWLSANGWNPNYVITPEMKLLKTSLLRQGWIQPVLVSLEQEAKDQATPRYTIIDGFHRSTLVKTDAEVRGMTNGLVPCAVLELSKPEAMMLTVRINRAKGSHIAIKMHELVAELVNDLGMTLEQVCAGIGATKHEVETLLTDDLFKKLNVANTPYTQAWTPRR